MQDETAVAAVAGGTESSASPNNNNNNINNDDNNNDDNKIIVNSETPCGGEQAAATLMDEYEEIREQDRYLPIANIARIMKNSLPENAKIAKDSKETVQECVSEFISFITSEASDRCSKEKRKTINGDDLLFALSTLGFDRYVEPLKLYLLKYRESVRLSNPKAGPSSSRASGGAGGAG
eukprot:CAMPEP_0198144220 /NCGR_PEP_ID=MMETSP1443-20131203/14218_1 /TAXON_ID=186043 /ORGANISM="Entomoneis sp., Strain CCMP2396" /LENGTH=178 /DNA_ID=CAMNT_0043807577 /DNA_START=92 /DNA_END=625 /DNA_ORIENTATION=-